MYLLRTIAKIILIFITITVVVYAFTHVLPSVLSAGKHLLNVMVSTFEKLMNAVSR